MVKLSCPSMYVYHICLPKSWLENGQWLIAISSWNIQNTKFVIWLTNIISIHKLIQVALIHSYKFVDTK